MARLHTIVAQPHLYLLYDRPASCSISTRKVHGPYRKLHIPSFQHLRALPWHSALCSSALCRYVPSALLPAGQAQQPGMSTWAPACGVSRSASTAYCAASALVHVASYHSHTLEYFQEHFQPSGARLSPVCRCSHCQCATVVS